MSRQNHWDVSARQAQALAALADPAVEEVMYGGAKGGGKSFVGCIWAWTEGYNLARLIPDKLRNPLVVGWMGRKIGRDFKDTTLETWKKAVHPDTYRIQGNPAEIVIGERVKILTGGLDSRETINKFNSAEFAMVFVDQAEETTKDDISVLRAASHNRLIVNGHKQPGKILWTANPAQCWLKGEFIDHPDPAHRYVQALPSDNPWLGAAYVETLRRSFEYRPELLRAYLYGSWDVLEGVDQCIKTLWVEQARTAVVPFPDTRRVVAVDTARFGDDETVVYGLENTEILHETIRPQTTAPDIVEIAVRTSHLLDDCVICVESTGNDIGAAVVDMLLAQGRKVLVFCPQGKVKNQLVEDRFYNQRAEAWGTAARMFGTGIVQCRNMGVKLAEQLTVPKYTFRGNKTLIEDKQSIKERLGQSPDRADAYVIGLWALSQVASVESQEAELPDRYRERRNNRRSAMCMG